MPADWDKGELRDVRILDGTIDVKYKRILDGIRLTVRNHTTFPVIAETMSDFPVELVLEQTQTQIQKINLHNTRDALLHPGSFHFLLFQAR